jgi:hypothetical protein
LFRTGVTIHTGIGHAGNGASDGVNDAEAQDTKILNLFKSGNGIGGFAGLADGN